MRIISGQFKGRYIKTRKGIKPTEAKLRKGLFDILTDKIPESRFLELFCGTGSVGIEALSRGVKEVLFVENDQQCIEILKENLTSIPHTIYSIFRSSVFKAIETLSGDKRRFDIIFLDPPYYRNLAKKTLNQLAKYDILAPCGIIVVQHHKKDILPKKIEGLTVYRQQKYGDTILSFYIKR